MKIPGELDLFRKELEEALKPIEEKHSVALDVGAFSYNREGTSFTCKLTTANVTAETKDLSATQIKQRAAYKESAVLYGLKPEWLDQEFEGQGQTFKIIGLNRRASKRPVSCTSQGKEYGFPTESIKLRMNAVEANKKNA
jgi:hypothetical protein